MGIFSRLADRWRSAPGAIVAIVALLLLAGAAIIYQNEVAHRAQQTQAARVQAEMLAASVAAALDFGDAPTAQEAVDVMQVNRQVRTVGIYDSTGRLLAGYGRNGLDPAPSEAQPQGGLDGGVAATVPVISAGERIGSVYLAADREPLSRRITRYAFIALLVLMAALVIAVLGTAQAVLRRANAALEERARSLAEANAELKVQIEERGKAEDQLRQAHKMQALGQLTGGIAHDFNNLLTVIQGSADMLARPELTEPKRLRFAEAVVQAASRAAALTGQLLAFARRQPLTPEAIDVNSLILGMRDLLDRTLGERVEVRTDLTGDSCTVEADRAQLESALLNIAVNSRDAMPDGGTLTLRTAPAQGEDGEAMLAVSVSDTGSGMDEETLSRAFEPFFTTKGAGKGTGLGLSQVYGFATQSGGEARVESVAGEGTTVTLLLPCGGRTETAATEAEAPGAEHRRRGRILVVEDNEEVGEFAEALLVELGHEVARARSAAAAIELAERSRFDLVFSDVVMPGMSGLDLAARLAKDRPGLPVVLTTGFSDEITRSGTGGRPVILKPYRLETLAAAIDEALGGGAK